ncbi:MAG: protein kinase domain-containing protein [Terriglobales bacterium]
MIGQTISHYRITGQLGSGGMGVVYEAQDLTLGRRVALKFLPPELARDQAALDRFLLEARAASALNHPNICTIYAVENSGGQSFISMELLEGQSLDRKLEAGLVPLDRLLDISLQLADALDAAHAKGIVHRDIKPANIFITQRGPVKILDFGLAKLTRAAETAMETVASSGPMHLTSPGSTVGTIAYMSPEQARGEELDARSDLFSLGTVIYQISTGHLPFSGNTSAVIFNAILERDPVPATQINPTVPPKLQEIIGKLLEKDRDLRYQSAADLRGDLKRLKRDTESGHTPRQVAAPSGTGTTPAASSARTSSSSAVVAAARQHKLGVGVTSLIAILLVAAAAYGIYAFLSRARPVPFQNVSVNKITQTGQARLVAISPDGKYILSVVDDKGQQSLWLRNVPTNGNTQVMPPESLRYLGVRFSPDGNYLYFVRGEQGQALSFLYRAPVLGGTPQKLVTDVDSNITFSPDGSSLAYVVQNNPELGKFRLVVHSLESGEEKTLVMGPLNQLLNYPAWSPDGKTIVCTISQPGDAFRGLAAIDPLTGKQTLFSESKWTFLSKPVWLPNGRGLLAVSYDKETNLTRGRIVEISYPDGTVRAVTHDISDYEDLSLAADGQTLATVLEQSHYDLFAVPASALGSGQAEQLTSGAPLYEFSWTPDGRMIFSQDFALNLFNVATRSKTPLTLSQQDGLAFQPSACANGRYIVFTLAGHGGARTRTIWRMDSSGGNLKPLSDGKADSGALCSPDGQWALYWDNSTGTRLTKVPLEGGKPEKLSELPIASGFDISPDGKLAAFATFGAPGSPREVLALVPVYSPHNPKLLELQRPHDGATRFTRDGKAVVYPFRDKDADNLWLQPLDGSPGKQLTNFKSERIADFRWSFDGKQLGLSRGHTDSDVVLLQESKP